MQMNTRTGPQLAQARQPGKVSALRFAVLSLCVAAASTLPTVQAQTARAGAAAESSRAAWVELKGAVPEVSATGAERAVRARALRAVTLDRNLIVSALARAPMEFTAAARSAPAVLSLPHPDGSFQRFAVVESPVMEAGLAAKHPHMKTYSGVGIDDPTATLRVSVTQLGVHSSVRSLAGNWYVEPLFQADESLYASYLRSEVAAPLTRFADAPVGQSMLSLQRGRFHASNDVNVMGAGFAPNAVVTISVRQAGDQAVRQVVTTTADARGSISATFKADPWRTVGNYELTATDGRTTSSSNYQVVADGATLNSVTGSQLRTYRLALVTDPSYATFFGGSANVTAAKVTLMNRVNQVYEGDLSARMVLIASTDQLNLDTAAQATGTNGPCGGAACFTALTCGSTLNANRTVTGLIAGARNFDVGHIAIGSGGGGVAGLGVVGRADKARGCTALTPIGDVWAIDFVAHELGHQFAGNHTFNGVTGSCSGGNRNAANSVEPGSGSSVMAYAGICGTDNTQNNSDPYFSQRSFDEIYNHINGNEETLNEQQQAALRSFGTAGQQFRLRLNGADSAPIVAGTNYDAAGVKAAIEAIPGWPAGGTVTIASLTNTGFLINYGGTLAGTDVPNLELVSCTAPCTGFVNDIVKGSLTTKGGTVTATGNNPPNVTAPAGFTIPVRTPFALTGGGTDPDGDTVTYMWEQNDRGAAAGTGLPATVKTNGPLFRQFGTRAVFNANIYNPPGQNQVTTNPTRVFPDLPQILANQTNAETGNCSALTGDALLNCNSEWLPTADYVGFAGVNASPARLNMRLTTRDGRGGVNSADTVLTLAPGAGPFLVTYPNTTVTVRSESAQTITWSVANTDVAPVNAANVRISMSVDGGLTYPLLLAASVPNTGSRNVIMPLIGTTQGRIKVEAVGNVFFDVSNSNFTVTLVADLNNDGVLTCADLAIVQAALGTSVGQPGFVPAADINGSGTIDARDVAYVAERMPSRVCAPQVTVRAGR